MNRELVAHSTKQAAGATTLDPAPGLDLLGFCTIALSPLLLLALLGLSAGCRIAQGVADLPGQAVRAVSPREKELQTIDFAALQNSLLRFADEFTANLALAFSDVRVEGQPLSHSEQLTGKLNASTEIWGIATSANPLTSLLDMTVVVTATRISTETYWIPEVYGESGQPLLKNTRRAETNIWQIADGVLSPAEQKELRSAIQDWAAQNQDPRATLHLRSGNLFTSVASAQTAPEPSGARGGMLGLINLDPLAGLDPATREITQMRLLAERAAFLLQRYPWVLRWQAELLAYNTAELPEVQQLITNSTSLTLSADRLSRTAEQLPGQIQEERRIVLEALESQSGSLTELAGEVHRALAAGSQMASNVNTALTTFTAVADTLGLNHPKPAPTEPTTPFRISDYAETAQRIDAMAARLNELLLTFDQTLGSTNLAKVPAQADQVLQQATADGQALVDYAIRRTLVFVLLCCFLVLSTALLFRGLTPRRRSVSPPSPSE